MVDYETFKLMHFHGDEQFPMEERAHHDPAEHDPERGWRQGAKFFRCTRCAEEVVVMPASQDRPTQDPA